MDELFETKDKQITPYLLTRRDISFKGTKREDNTLYFLFSPKKLAQNLANLFVTHQVEPVDPTTLLEADETYRDFIFGMKEKNKNHELSKS